MLTIALAIVVLVLVWILVREHQGARKIFNNEREKKDIIKRYMDLNHTHMMLTGTLQKAEALNGKYTLILNVLRSRFPHAWEIVINELFPEQEVEDPCKSGAGEGLDSRLRGNDGQTPTGQTHRSAPTDKGVRK